MNYTKESCPVCGKQFTETDDIAVCPVCGTPHHRECYLEQKECSNKSKHSEGFEWKPSDEISLPFVEHIATQQSEPQKIVCPYCGSQNAPEEPVCTTCGARLYNNPPENGVPFGQIPTYGAPNIVQIQPGDIISGHTVADTADFVQRNANKYIPRFYKMERTGKKLSFNWAAFIFGPYWYFYRKLPIIGFLMMLVMLTASILCTTPDVRAAMNEFSAAYEQFMAGNSNVTQQQISDMLMSIYTMPEMLISSLFNIVIHVFAGLFANALYKNKVKKDIDWAKESAGTPEQYRLLLFSRGGVSLLMVALSAVGYFCADQILSRVLFGG